MLKSEWWKHIFLLVLFLLILKRVKVLNPHVYADRQEPFFGQKLTDQKQDVASCGDADGIH